MLKYCNYCGKKFKLPEENEGSNKHWYKILQKKRWVVYVCRQKSKDYFLKQKEKPNYYKDFYDNRLKPYYNTTEGFLKKRHNTMMVRKIYENVFGYNIYKDMEVLSKEDFIKWGKKTLPPFMEENQLDRPFDNKVYVIRKDKKEGFVPKNIEWFTVNGYKSVAERTVGIAIQLCKRSGKVIKEWKSITTAARSNDMTICQIASICEGRTKQEGLTFFKYKKSDTIPEYIGKKERRIKQISLSGKTIKIWKNLKEIGEKTDFKRCNISMALHYRQKTSHGYIWREEGDDNLPDLSYLIDRKIVQKDLDGNIIKIWNGRKPIIKSSKYNYSCVLNCIKGIIKTSSGYKWEYFE